MNIGLLLKQTPLKLKSGADGLMDRSGASQINPYCKNALEEAIKLKNTVDGSKLFVFTMGPPNFQQSLRKAISMGADEGILLSDRRLAGSDTMATAKALSKLISTQNIPFNIIFAGLQTVDGDTAHVGPQVAERLGFNQATYVDLIKLHVMNGINGIKVRRLIEKGYQHLFVPFPALVTITNTANTPRGPNLLGAMIAKRAKIKTFSVDDLKLSAENVGLSGSPTVVSKVKNVKSTRLQEKITSDSAAGQVVQFFDVISKLDGSTIE